MNTLAIRRAGTTAGASSDSIDLAVLRLLHSSPEVSQRQVASKLGVSVGRVNYCVRALVKKGLVKAQNYRKSTNKLGYFYLLTPSGVAAKAELTRRFLERKLREYEELHLEIEQLKREAND